MLIKERILFVKLTKNICIHIIFQSVVTGTLETVHFRGFMSLTYSAYSYILINILGIENE